MDKNKLAQTVIAVAFMTCIVTVFCINIKVPVAALISVYNKKDIDEITSAFELNFNNTFPHKTAFVDINGLGHRLLQQREMGGVVLLSNGMESEGVPEMPEEGIRANAQSLTEFSNWVQNDRKANFLYVQIPWKNSKYDARFPEGIYDYSNATADNFLRYLKENSVHNLDLRESIHKDDIDLYSLFLKTEHHWNPYGGFYAFTKISAYMQENFGEIIDSSVLDINNYWQDTYKNYSLGYYGQRTGFLFAGLDDFTMIYPKFDTEQTCEIPHKEILREGNFYNTVFDLETLELPWRKRGMYTVYIGGDYPLVIHKSKTAVNGKTIMLFIDSFGTPIESFFTTAYQNVIAVDLRWVLRCGWKETAVDLINKYEPNTVIVTFNPNQIGDADNEQFAYGL